MNSILSGIRSAQHAICMKNEPNKAVEPTIIHVTNRAPSSTLRAMYDRGSL
jgi:hypothetical protein